MNTDEIIDIIREIIRSDGDIVMNKQLSAQKFENKSHCMFACAEMLHRLMDYKSRMMASDYPWDDDPVSVINDFYTEMCYYARKTHDKFTEQVFIDCMFMAGELINVIDNY